ncbi:MAG: hypothetical protein LBV57_03085 [Candidatus Symbiothrix sp.]|jgi:hypothetical protein|nr:hypothetical protein [Candidatus Symbiothrix sp.]
MLIAQNGYDKRVEKRQDKWAKLIPTHTLVQFAGGMGFLSLGTGWDYGKKEQWETDALLGFLPKFSTDKNKITFTMKENYIPWKKDFNDYFAYNPLTCGLYFNTIFDDDFWVNQPDKYPNKYYSFSTKIRFNIYVGQRFTFKIPPEKRVFAKEISAFYEISSSDLYIISAVGNGYLKPQDYLRLSFGLKLQLF